MKALKKIGLAGVLVLASCFLVAAPSQAINIYDNFNDNSLDTNIWPEVFIEVGGDADHAVRGSGCGRGTLRLAELLRPERH